MAFASDVLGTGFSILAVTGTGWAGASRAAAFAWIPSADARPPHRIQCNSWSLIPASFPLLDWALIYGFPYPMAASETPSNTSL